MIENKNIADAMMEVENAENLEQLREAVLSVTKAIDREISWLNERLGDR